MQKYKSEQERKRIVGGEAVAVKNELEMCGSLNTLH